MTDRGWVKAGELHEGSKVLNSRKEYEVVESIEYKGYNEIEVYNLIVENYHTFFITELGLMVHNIDCKNATLGQIFKQVGDNISDTKIKGDFEDVIKKLDDIAERNNIEEYIKNFDSRFRGLDPNNLDEIKKIISDASKDIDNHSSSLFKGTEGVGNRNALLRGDSALYSDTRPNGIRKSYISSEGSLVPANIDGLYKGRQVTVTEHILGGYRKGAKGNSPYTSFTFNSDIVAGYGDNLIEIDISGLRKAIQSGDVTDVAILSPKQIERLIKNDKIQSDFWKKRALNWTKRDSEYLIRGKIPSQFIKINK